MRIFWLTFLGAMLALATPAQAQRFGELGILALDPVDDGNTVLQVSGKGNVVRTADVAIFTAGVTSVGDTADQALRANAKKMTAVLRAARALGIADKDIQTSSIRIDPVMSNNRRQVARYRSYSTAMSDAAMVAEAAAEAVEEAAMAVEDAAVEEAPRIVGYTASNSVTIRQRDLEQFGRTIDRLVAAGANTVDGPRFMLDDSEATQEEARIMAIADARKRAEIYAEAAGMKVIRIVMMEEGRVSGLSSRGSNTFGFYQAMEVPMDYYETPTESGILNISANVGMLFEIGPK